MLKLKTGISIKHNIALNRDIKEYIQKKPMVPCKALNKRPVFLNKYLKASQGRRDQTRRRQRFMSAVELLRQAKTEDITDQIKEPGGETAYELKEITPKGEIIGVHIREEIEAKDRRLYLISTF